MAFEDYTHFTSPIRRYPDLVVHRLLKSLENNEPPALSKINVEEIAHHCTETEKKADDLEKKINGKKKTRLLQLAFKKRKSATFNGFIVGIKKRGMIIELPDSLQRGMVAFKSIRSDWLEADETFTRVENRDGVIRYKLGDPLEVMIAKVDMDRALLDFAISGEPKQKSKRNHKRRVEPDLRSGRPKTYSKQRRRRKKR